MSTILQPILSLLGASLRWWTVTRPARKVLQGIAENGELVRVFVRDLFLPDDGVVLAREGTNGPLLSLPNVRKLWPEVEGKGIGYVFNALGQINKSRNIDIVPMGEDPGLWDSHLVILGAQAQKSFDYYQRMAGVMYRMDGEQIRVRSTDESIAREEGYGYGIILKAKNPLLRDGKVGTAILIGGFGTLGTVAAAYYFRDHVADLGRKFGKRPFGIVVRAPVTTGEQAVERLWQFDLASE